MLPRQIYNYLLLGSFIIVGDARAQGTADPSAPPTASTPAAVSPANEPGGAATPRPAADPQEGIAAAASPPPAAAPAAASPPAVPAPVQPATPYSLPWGLRPIVPVTVLRLDNVVATYQDPKNLAEGSGVTWSIMTLGGLRLTPNLMGIVRWGIIANWPPGAAGGVSVSNPALGGLYSLRWGSLRLGLFLGVTVPIGTGGDKTAEPSATAATQAGLFSRSAMDNAMFAVNDFTVFPGIDFAYIAHRLTLQVEATVLQLMRVKNEAVQSDAFRTNFTLGFHAGFFVAKALSLSAELRYQRWLTTPSAVAVDESLRHNLSLALGPRFHIKVRDHWFRPGLAYEVGIHGTMYDRAYHLVQIDFPFIL